MRVCRTPNNDEKKNTDKKIIATKFNLLFYFAFIYSSLKLKKYRATRVRAMIKNVKQKSKKRKEEKIITKY